MLLLKMWSKYVPSRRVRYKNMGWITNEKKQKLEKYILAHKQFYFKRARGGWVWYSRINYHNT